MMRGTIAVATLCALMSATPVHAQDEDEDAVSLNDDNVDAIIELGEDTARSPSDPYEDPQETYLFLGAFYRHTFLPGFMLGLFLGDYTSTNNPSFGLEMTYRRDGMDIIGGLSYQTFEVHGPFRADGDPETDVEYIDSDISVVLASATFLWSTDFNDMVSLQYGLGLGVGVTLGNIIRNEAYPDANNDSGHAVNGFSRCDGPGMNNPAYCESNRADPADPDSRGGHYDFEAAKWFDGGSVPNIYFRAAIPHLALRIKPVRQFMMRIDGGFDIFSGFFVGGSMAYGF